MAKRVMYEFQLGIPEWAKERVASRRRKYPFEEMPVKSYFDIPVGYDQPALVSVQQACYQYSKRLGRRFMCHQFDDGLIQVYRAE